MMLSSHPGRNGRAALCCKCAPALPHFFFPGCPACPHLPAHAASAARRGRRLLARRGPQQWFSKNAAFDAEFRRRFERHIAAATRELDDWLGDSTGALALMVLLDQFPRNAYRGTAHMFATDPLARYCAEYAIGVGRDLAVDAQLRQFFYLPRARRGPGGAGTRRGADGGAGRRHAALGGPASRHHQAFRSFPHRNAALGR